MAKAQKEAMYLVSTAGTGYFYTIRRNKKKGKQGSGKLELTKFDPIAKAHVLFKEKKLSKLKKRFDKEAFQKESAAE